jgi:hypothetical protein
MTDMTEVTIEIRCLHASRPGSPRAPAPEVVESVVGEAAPARPGGVSAGRGLGRGANIVLVSSCPTLTRRTRPQARTLAQLRSTWCR